MDVEVAVGKSGRDEIVACIRTMAEEGLSPEDINEKTFERTSRSVIPRTLSLKPADITSPISLSGSQFILNSSFQMSTGNYSGKLTFSEALRDYQERVRKFGE